MEFNVLVMEEERSKRLIRQFSLLKETPKMVCSPFSSSVFLVQARKYLTAGKIFSSLITPAVFHC